MYLLVGNWSPDPGAKGISVYEYLEENGAIRRQNRCHENIAASYLVQAGSAQLVYATDETDAVVDGIPMNQILALEVSASSAGVRIAARKPSLGPNPDWICPAFSGSHLLVGHHGGFSHTSAIGTDPQGRFEERIRYDAPHVVLYRLDEEGLPDTAADVFLPAKEDYYPGQFSRSHCIIRAPGRNLYVICDTGLDQILSVTVDFTSETILLLDRICVQRGFAPRHGVFHPSAPICYVDMESTPVVYACSCDAGGNLTVIQELNLTDKLRDLAIPRSSRFQKIMPSGIILSADGAHLYMGLRGVNRIAVIDIDQNGHMSLRQICSQAGQDPNALALSPDGRYLLCANVFAGTVTRFAVRPDGTLRYQGIAAADTCPASLLFLT